MMLEFLSWAKFKTFIDDNAGYKLFYLSRAGRACQIKALVRGHFFTVSIVDQSDRDDFDNNYKASAYALE